MQNDGVTASSQGIYKKKFAEAVKWNRELKHWSQKKLADKLGVTVRTIQNWENSNKDTLPSQETLEKVCDLLNIDSTILYEANNIEAEAKEPMKKVVIENTVSEATNAALAKNKLVEPASTTTPQPTPIRTMGRISHARRTRTVYPRLINAPVPHHRSWSSAALALIAIIGLVAVIITTLPTVLRYTLSTNQIISPRRIPTTVPIKRAPTTLSGWANITPVQLAQLTPTRTDTLSDANSLNWTAPQGFEKVRSCQFTSNGLHVTDRSYWPLGICDEQAIPFANFAVQVDITFLPSSTPSQPHGAGVVLRATDASDGATMLRVRIGDDITYDFYVQSDDAAQRGRLDACPNLNDPNAQSTLHNDSNDPVFHHILPSVGQTNTITIVVVGHLTTLHINGQKVQSVCEHTTTSGLLGLFAASPFPNERTDVLFTHLKIYTF